MNTLCHSAPPFAMRPSLPHARATAAARHAARVAAWPLHPFHATRSAVRHIVPRSTTDDRVLATEVIRMQGDAPAQNRLALDSDVGALAARVAALPGKKAAKALKKAQKALMKALKESSESSESSEDEHVQLPAVATTAATTGRRTTTPPASLGTAGARALAFSLAGAARRAAAVESVVVVPDAPRIDEDASTTPPRVSVCTGPACTRLGADRIILALEADYPGGVRKCGCLGECEAGRAAVSARTAWFAAEDGVALPMALAADALADGEASDSAGSLELAG